MNHATTLSGLLAWTLLTPALAMAQPATGDVGLEEIVVTAQRRAENLQDVPIAVTAITASTAAKLGLTDPIMLSRAAPGMSFGRNGAAATPFIRGVGSAGANVGNEPSVTTFIDDVYIPSGAAGAFELNNIASVEVLKGPQGTLFGRNATGGLIHIRTNLPTHEPTATVSGTYANYRTATGQIYGSAGLTDQVAANLALVYSNQDDGWGRNLATGEDIYKSEAYGGRLRVLYEPGADDTLLLGYSYDYRKSTVGVALRAGQGLFSVGGYSPDRAGAGYYDVTSNDADPYRLRMQQGSAKYTHDFEAARLVSISAYTDLNIHAITDSDTTPIRLIRAGDYQMRSRMFTQEFQLLSQPDAAVQWILGAYFLKDKSIFSGPFSGVAFPAGSVQTITTQMKTDSYSGFAQASAELMPKTRLTIGLRYTADQRDFVGALRLAPPAGPSLAYTGILRDDKTFSEMTGRLALDHKLTDDVMIYAAYNRGFKSGVYNLPSLTTASTTAPPPVDPEQLNAYSAGFKSQFWDNRVRLNAEAYLYDYKNIQVVVQIPGAQQLTNAGAARIKGFDADLTVAPIEHLTITAGLSIIDGKYTRFPGGPTFLPQPPNAPVPLPTGCVNAAGAPVTTYPVSTAPEVQVACDLSGKKTIQTPPLSFNLTAAYRIPSALGPFDLTASWTHGGGFYWDADNSHKEPTNDVLSASVQWSDITERYCVRLWSQNLGQEKYASYGANSATSNYKYSPNPPRTYGVTITAKY